ncbi:hypothetical protein GF374_02070 [Candidatus Woesearchaeota archaeon]|nr:hypothetical protein [Candidatus Woesearchaeota archaeon]
MVKNINKIIIISIIVLVSVIFIQSYGARVYQLAGAGTAATGTVGIQILPYSICQVDMDQYWNFISLCSNASNKSISSILSGINYRYVMQWNRTSQEWSIYSPKAASNPFDKFTANNSYFIYLKDSNDTLLCTGDLLNDTNISLTQYWNAPSWPYNFSTSIDNQSASVNTTFRYEMKWNTSAQEWNIYSPKAASNPFNSIFIGEGKIMYISNATALLVYNTSKL